MKGIKIRTGAKLLIFVQPSVYREEGANPTMTTIDSINRVCSNLAWNVALTWTCVWMLISMVRADQTQSHNLTATALWPFDPAELGWASAFTKERLTQTTTGFLWAGCPSCHSTYSVKTLQENPVVWLSFVLPYIHGISTVSYTHLTLPTIYSV